MKQARAAAPRIFGGAVAILQGHNMSHQMKYRTADTTRQRRLRRCTNIDNPEDLKSELGAMRLLALEALEQGNAALADRLLTGIGKLAQTQVAVKAKCNEYLEKTAVRNFIVRAVNILADVVEDKFEGWEDAIDKAADLITSDLDATTNEKDKQ